MIRVTNVSHQIDGKGILQRLDFSVPKGELVCLVGANGAGKSTLLSLIARLEPVQAGQIFVDDLDVSACDSNLLARKLAILPQFNEVSLRLTVEELVGFGRYPYHKGRPSEEDTVRVDEALSALDIADLRERPLQSLSGGQRQRALLAMTFAQDTDYVRLDEPLNNLDIGSSRRLMSQLRTLAVEHSRTVLIVLHDINYASRYADRIFTLKSGVLGPSGRPQAVVSQGFIQDVFDTDADVVTVDGRPVVLV
ncbi:MAG: ATP-binding cassette domain-containing protein [Pseudomonadota bacterium]